MEAAPSTDQNANVLDYLRYYTDPARELDYAVLVAGPWGSGKTYLLKNFLKSISIKPIYVSLYGMTSTAQIDEEFYRQLHPFLASKGMKVFGAIVRGAVKGTLKIDLNGDGKDDGAWSAGIPEIDLAKELGNPRERLLVFDDLERVKMPVSEVLGYINSFVEHDGLKAILLANEQEIVRHVDSRYPDIKEKLIGQTLTIAAPAETAFDVFVTTIQDGKTAEFLIAHKADILATHSAGGHNNLRMLKQAMWDFERVARHFEDRHWANPSAVLKAMDAVLALSLEHRSGRLKEGQIAKLIGNSFGRMFRSELNKEATPEQEIEDRYPHLDFDNTILDAGLLEAVIVRGESDGARVQAVLDGNINYAAVGDQPLWLRAWNSFLSDDATTAAIVTEVEQGFQERIFRVREELLHIFGVRLWYAKIGLIRQSPDELVAEGQAYIDDLEAQGLIPSTLQEEERGNDSLYAMKGTLEADNVSYQALAEYYAHAALRASEREYLAIAVKLFNRLESEPREFLLDLVHNGIRRSPYGDVPVLAALPSAYVAELAFNAAPDTQLELIQALGGRYEHNRFDRLAAERPWLRAFYKDLMARLPAAEPMNRHRLQSLLGRNLQPRLDAWGEEETFAALAAAQASAATPPPAPSPLASPAVTAPKAPKRPRAKKPIAGAGAQAETQE
ncbi:MAG: hypothetical protein KF730_17225 [Sphingomonas sp.]|uniref:P-loop NTPase fold protein n=1 Tax=Sphingomonas sp. TaxID=28214 RepID=UPI0026008DCA|nr:P-loop NTPase fold protein [Sphingomonas sp.]MBX3566304.1 hypothetical protein [Sphingomonas sp.]